MSAQIIPLIANQSGNGAREALIEMVKQLPQRSDLHEAALQADWLLCSLWLKGFKIVPLQEER
jgi:hypothetical protein